MLIPILAWDLTPADSTIPNPPGRVFKGKPPRPRKPPAVTYGSWMLPIDASGELTEDEFLMLSSIDID